MMAKCLLILLIIISTSLVAQTKNQAIIKIKKDDIDISKGKKIYIDNCKVCHDNSRLGPKLNGVTKKYSKKWILDFTVNSERFIKLKDKDAVKIWLAWKKAPMTVYTGFTKESLDQLYAYLETLK